MHLHATLDDRAMRQSPAITPPPASAIPVFDLGGAERRMHARAYGQWVSLLHGRPLPSIADIDPATIAMRFTPDLASAITVSSV